MLPLASLKKIIFKVTLFLLLASALYYSWEWLFYVAHLVRHQVYVLTSRIPIAQLLQQDTSLTTTQREKLTLILEVRQYAQELYALENSYTFASYVDLKRSTLGWNLTATEEFSFEPLQFKFPLLGSFGYLGFFDYQLAQKKAEQLKNSHHDIYLSEIGGYSTLGWFNDPVFNTYLDLPEVSLVRLILHETSHEKLYFKDDSNFSESLSTFIEREATHRFYQERRHQPLPQQQSKEILKEYEQFWQLVDRTTQQLKQLYQKDIPLEEKRLQKKQLYYKLQQQLRQAHKNYRYIQAPAVLASYPELNNAIILQYRRYTPQKKNGFARLLRDCQQDIPCWFDQLAKLKNCPQGRKLFLSDDIPLSQALQACQ